MKTVYLAGPEVFLKSAVTVGAKKKELCAKYGFEGLFPLDNELTCTSNKARSIYLGNMCLISRADFCIANLEAFRGANVDDGTAFEIGYCVAKNKPVFGYFDSDLEYIEKVKHSKMATYGSNCDHYNMHIEDFKLPCNLMLVHAIANSGGKIFSRTSENSPPPRCQPNTDRFESLDVFEEVLKYVAQLGK